jgi:AraC-like DNA-binding protein
MTDARQDDEFGSANATRELASQHRFVLHSVGVSDNDRGRNVDVANQLADVERHTLLEPTAFCCQRASKGVVGHLFSQFRRELPGGEDEPIEMIARNVGFGDKDRMRRAFLRIYGQPPRALRRGRG